MSVTSLSERAGCLGLRLLVILQAECGSLRTTHKMSSQLREMRKEEDIDFLAALRHLQTLTGHKVKAYFPYKRQKIYIIYICMKYRRMSESLRVKASYANLAISISILVQWLSTASFDHFPPQTHSNKQSF